MPTFKIFLSGMAEIHGHVFVDADSQEEAESNAAKVDNEDFNLDCYKIISLKNEGRD
jgi:hypothetical protein